VEKATAEKIAIMRSTFPVQVKHEEYDNRFFKKLAALLGG
jgi:hypothetical protein